MSTERTAELIEVFRKALMVQHHNDWDMDTVSEAAHICAKAAGVRSEAERPNRDQIERAILAHDDLQEISRRQVRGMVDSVLALFAPSGQVSDER